MVDLNKISLYQLLIYILNIRLLLSALMPMGLEQVGMGLETLEENKGERVEEILLNLR